MTDKHWHLLIFIILNFILWYSGAWDRKKDKEIKKDTEETSPFSKPSYVFSPIVAAVGAVGIILLVASILLLYFS